MSQLSRKYQGVMGDAKHVKREFTRMLELSKMDKPKAWAISKEVENLASSTYHIGIAPSDCELLYKLQTQIYRLVVWSSSLFYTKTPMSDRLAQSHNIADQSVESFWVAFWEYSKLIDELTDWLRKWGDENIYNLTDAARFLCAEIRSEGSPVFFRNLTDNDIIAMALKAMWSADGRMFAGLVEQYDNEHPDD